MGVNMNLAPALDVNNNNRKIPYINTRSFGSDPAVVAGHGARGISAVSRRHDVWR
jgi:beta-glucosidase-like glycosyl hydrolase